MSRRDGRQKGWHVKPLNRRELADWVAERPVALPKRSKEDRDREVAVLKYRLDKGLPLFEGEGPEKTGCSVYD